MSTPSFLDRLRRFDPAVLPILIAGLVLVGAVVWLLARPLPPQTSAAETRLNEEIARLRAEVERQSALERRVAGLEGTANRLAVLENRPAPDLAPLREATAETTGRLEAVERAAQEAAQAAQEAARAAEAAGSRAAVLEERVTGNARAAEQGTSRLAALDERLAATARDLAARPNLDPATLAERAALEALSGRLDRIETAAREQQARDAQDTARIEAIGRDAAARQAAMEQALIALNGRLAGAEQALVARGQADETLARGITQLESGTGQRFTALEAAIVARTAALEQAVAQRTAALEAAIQSRTAALDATLGQRGAAIEQQAARIAQLEGASQRLAALEGRSQRLATVDQLRTALDAGRPLGAGLASLQNAPEALSRFASTPPPTEAALRLSFEEAARTARQASEPAREGSGVMEGALSRLQGLVTVRRGEDVVWGDAAGAEIERARRALEAGDLEGSLRHLQRLPQAAREAIRGWTSQAEALVAARAALRQVAEG
jgi:hypothetical protein